MFFFARPSSEGSQIDGIGCMDTHLMLELREGYRDVPPDSRRRVLSASASTIVASCFKYTHTSAHQQKNSKEEGCLSAWMRVGVRPSTHSRHEVPGFILIEGRTMSDRRVIRPRFQLPRSISLSPCRLTMTHILFSSFFLKFHSKPMFCAHETPLPDTFLLCS